MKSSKGFTIIELVVALLVLSLVVVTAVSFFVYQSGYGRESSKQKFARESIALAMMMIRQDVMHAGFGVYDKPSLSLHLADFTPSVSENGKVKYLAAYRELYVNYGRYLQGDYSATTSNIFTSNAYFNGWGNSSLTTNLTPIDIGCLLHFKAGIPTDTRGVVNFNGYQPAGSDTYTYSLDTTLSPPDFSGGPYYAFAVCYKLSPQNPAQPFDAETNPYTRLTRNGETILGGEPQFKVTDFRVRAMFFNSGEIWSPDCDSDGNCIANRDFDSSTFALNLANLREVQITVVYRLSQQRAIRDPSKTTPVEEQWTRDYSRTIRVSPRVVVLTKY